MKYIIEKKKDKVFSFLLDDAGHAVEIHVDDPADGPKIGDIYIGIVQKVAKNINAAFVELVPGINGYLPLDEMVSPIYVSKGPSPELQAGDQLAVQITREAFGRKDMSLSTKITLQGKHVVLILGGMGLGVSKKLPEQLRQEIKDRILCSEEFDALQKRIGQCGLVVRTSAARILEEESGNAEPKEVKAEDSPDLSEHLRREILNDISGLEAEMSDLRLRAPYRSVHSILKKQPPRWLTRILNLSGQMVETVVTDDRSLHRQMLQASEESGRRDLKFRLYEDHLVSMEKVYSLERELTRALGKKVDLKSGGDLVIESTEALHIIDVNSGRYQTGKQKEEALLDLNLEAAREAARQIRLRNLSGIIVIDFINLQQQKNSLRILDELRRSVLQDPVRTKVVDMTKLGLVEMTRQKIEVPLRDAVHAVE